MKMKSSKTLIIAIPLMILLFIILSYQYGYLRVKSDIAAIREQQDVKIKTLEKYITFISGKTQVEKDIVSLKEARKADDSKLIEGQTLALAAATLQETVKAILTERGGTISSERVGKPEEYGKFKIISISIDSVLPDSKALSDILYSIETRTPYLIIKEFDARVRNFREPKELTVKLDVSAITSGK